MGIIHIIKQDKVQALSDRMVFALCAGVGAASLALALITLWVLASSGFWWLALLIATPLASGFAHTTREWLRYCRPNWCKPKIG